MRLRSCENHINTDVLVIGGGMAGLFTAIRAKEQRLNVTLTDKGYISKAGSTNAQPGDILFFRPERGHNLEYWVNIINKRCEYLNNREWVEICLKESVDRYNDLVSWGVQFDEENGKPLVRKGYGFERKGVYKITGLVPRKYGPILRRKALESGVMVLDRIMICELIKQDGKIVGAIGFNTTSGDLYIFHAKATVIATGSTGFKPGTDHTSHYWTGDGEAMAYRAGTEITGADFAYGIYEGFLGLPKGPTLSSGSRLPKEIRFTVS